jgi:predicted ester cyclase
MSPEHNKAVVAKFDALGNEGGDIAILDEICTPDMVNHALAAHMPPGLEGTREFLRRSRRDLHGARWVTSIIVATDDMVVQFGSRTLTWPGGKLLGYEAPAGTATRDVAFAYRLVDGRIAERWAIRDDLSMLVQLGALPRPAPRSP